MPRFAVTGTSCPRRSIQPCRAPKAQVFNRQEARSQTLRAASQPGGAPGKRYLWAMTRTAQQCSSVSTASCLAAGRRAHQSASPEGETVLVVRQSSPLFPPVEIEAGQTSLQNVALCLQRTKGARWRGNDRARAISNRHGVGSAAAATAHYDALRSHSAGRRTVTSESHRADSQPMKLVSPAALALTTAGGGANQSWYIVTTHMNAKQAPISMPASNTIQAKG